MFKEGFPVDLGENEDRLDWFGGNTFQASKDWHTLREDPECVRWWKPIWFKGQVPTYGFIEWLVCLKRLPMKDRLKD
ncbi:hypothetical protein LIER_20251 [Lithospermum erythrorhizon]|uniref:Reverse transcriptase zinc-binding domain-containing protein n=1 Tax=Lithospermum erythrorhizon TaxID=34254 RepID=A0AAV3QRF8_LITER